MPFDEPDRTARSRRQGVLYEVYRIPMGAELYIPEPLSWALRALPGHAMVSGPATICSLANARARRTKLAAVRARRDALAEARRVSAEVRRRTRQPRAPES
ncbi:hypothetical protein [Phenylobacterium sp. LjRoot219]|uniref:hypothetical protein n=1 Tax=Phenylobacterium sp. LjRoot219 TaxID=3342283 RepID=UPI003F50C030